MNHGWEKIKIGQVCEVVGGATPRTDVPQYWGGQYNWVTPAELHGDKFFRSSERKLTFEGVKSANLQLLPIGAVLLTSRAPIGKVAIASEPTYCNQGFKSLICGPKMNNEFLYYYLIHNNEELQKAGSGTTFKEISKAKTESFFTLVPPMDVQIQIASEFDKINELIDMNRSLLRELESLTKSIFFDTFGDIVENQHSWPMATLGAVSQQISNGSGAKIEKDTYKKEGIMFFRCQNVWRNRFDYSDIVYIDEETNAKMHGSRLMHNDLIVTKIGRLFTENSSLGRVSLYEGPDYAANLSGNLSFIRLNSTVNPKFILHILISDYFRDYVRNTTSGGIDKRALNNSQLKALKIFLPPLELQNQFASQIEAIERQKADVEANIAELQTLLDSSMDYWFND